MRRSAARLGLAARHRPAALGPRRRGPRQRLHRGPHGAAVALEGAPDRLGEVAQQVEAVGHLHRLRRA
jgi:hypothetical protein